MAHERTKIEDYAFLSDTQTAAFGQSGRMCSRLVVSSSGSIAPACSASLLGDTKNGHWRFLPEEEVVERPTQLPWRLADPF